MNFHALCFAPKCNELVTMSWSIKQSQTLPNPRGLIQQEDVFMIAYSPGPGSGGSRTEIRPWEDPPQRVLRPSRSSTGSGHFCQK